MVLAMETGARLWMRTVAPAPPRAVSERSRCSDSGHSSRFRFMGWQDNRKLRFAGLHTSTSHTPRTQPIRVKSSDTDENSNPEIQILDEQSLQQDLETAIKQEDYTRAAKLRDQLLFVQEDSKASILSANSQFYNAFKTGNIKSMHAIWSKGDHVNVVHPSAGRIDGYEMVMGSWEMVLGADYEFPIQIDLKNVEVFVRGDVGYVSCMEVVKTKGNSWGKQVATNVFEKVNGQWFICIHHASHMDE